MTGSERRSTSSSDERTNSFFSVMADIYGDLWIKQHGLTPGGEFIRTIRELTDDALNRILRHASEDLGKGNRFSPSCGLMAVWAENPTDLELTESLMNIKDRKPKTKIDEYLMSMRKDLINTPEKYIDKVFKQMYMKAIFREKRGTLFLERDRILLEPPTEHGLTPVEVAKKTFDESGDPEIRRKVNDRINRIKSGGFRESDFL